MNKELKEKFVVLWKKYFPNAELPITFQYSDDTMGVEKEKIVEGHRCVIAQLLKVRRGESVYMQEECVNCRGGKRYLGFSQPMFPGFECFLSHEEMDRYKLVPAATSTGCSTGYAAYCCHNGASGESGRLCAGIICCVCV